MTIGGRRVYESDLESVLPYLDKRICEEIRREMPSAKAEEFLKEYFDRDYDKYELLQSIFDLNLWGEEEVESTYEVEFEFGVTGRDGLSEVSCMTAVLPDEDGNDVELYAEYVLSDREKSIYGSGYDELKEELRRQAEEKGIDPGYLYFSDEDYSDDDF